MYTNIEKAISEAFGSYRAEWMQDSIFKLFSTPVYFPELMTQRTCVLMGGRGTGKTTVLRCLSYEGQHALNTETDITKWDNFGLYYRVNTNRVTAFTGQEKSDDFWHPLFSHYFNLIISELTADFLSWYAKNTLKFSQDDESKILENVCDSLCIEASGTIEEFKKNVRKSKIKLETYINNIEEEKKPTLSMQSSPVDILFGNMRSVDAFKNCYFSLLIDEYENFLDYQQRIINTIIKHAGDSYVFKVGVKQFGWRDKSTLNKNEMLMNPADYNFIDISSRLSTTEFSVFAKDICNDRLNIIREKYPHFFSDISKSLQNMTEEEEAVALKVEDRVKSALKNEKDNISKNIITILKEKTPLEQYALLYFIDNWGKLGDNDISEYFESKQWKTKYGNYKHALLFTIASKSPSRKKYYAGWNTFVHLSSNNIRYLLELVEQSLLMFAKPGIKSVEEISCDIQTNAATYVAKKNLNELEGLTTYGAQITKLLLSLGRVFGLLAENIDNKAPEITQFEINESTSVPYDKNRLDEILDSAVMHLAMLRLGGSKLGNVAEVRDSDYMIHPIYAPYFIFSYRKKRKTRFDATDILALIDSPRVAIPKVLKDKGINEKGSLSQQLTLFVEHFNEG